MRIRCASSSFLPHGGATVQSGRRQPGRYALPGFPEGGPDPLAIQNPSDLLLAEGVAFNGQRALDGADAIDAPQPQRFDRLGLCSQSPEGFADLGYQAEDGRSDRVGRLVFALFIHASTRKRLKIELSIVVTTGNP